MHFFFYNWRDKLLVSLKIKKKIICFVLVKYFHSASMKNTQHSPASFCLTISSCYWGNYKKTKNKKKNWERAAQLSEQSAQSSRSWMSGINRLIAEYCRWEPCAVGQIVSYVQQLAQDCILFLQIITANALRDNNMVHKTCCKAVSVHSTNNPTLYKTTFALRRFHSCLPNRLGGTICSCL